MIKKLLSILFVFSLATVANAQIQGGGGGDQTFYTNGNGGVIFRVALQRAIDDSEQACQNAMETTIEEIKSDPSHEIVYAVMDLEFARGVSANVHRPAGYEAKHRYTVCWKSLDTYPIVVWFEVTDEEYSAANPNLPIVTTPAQALAVPNANYWTSNTLPNLITAPDFVTSFQWGETIYDDPILAPNWIDDWAVEYIAWIKNFQHSVGGTTPDLDENGDPVN
jgi:hypothetical protein